MLNKKTLFLFLALVLPIGIFLFLKFFGSNVFSVEPLYTKVYPEVTEGCTAIRSLPYTIPDSITLQLPQENADLVILKFGESGTVSTNQLRRTEEQFNNDPVVLVVMASTSRYDYWRHCIFFLKEPLDLVVVDRSGVIRGQYNSSEREEIDRLITELSILLMKY